MSTYEDVDWTWLRALTRERRRETQARREGKIVRYSVSLDSVVIIDVRAEWRGRMGSRHPVKWRRQQWRAGNRRCFYCEVQLIDSGPQDHPRLATTDHRQPRALGGRDHPTNFAMACFACNNRKGSMTEAEFRTQILCRLTA